MRKLLTAAMLGSVAMAGPAFAQTAAPEAVQVDPTTQPGVEPTINAQPTPQEGEVVVIEADADGRTQSEGGFVTWQEGDQMIASNLMGANVWGAEGESIGSVDDLLLDRDGQVIAVIVGIGGFLGIGEKDVAISNDQLEFVLTEDAVAADGVTGRDPAMAPASGVATAPAAPGTAGTVTPGAPMGTTATPGTAGAARTGMAGTAGTGLAGNRAAGTNWGWTGAGIDHIQVNYTREQLEAAPEFEFAD